MVTLYYCYLQVSELRHRASDETQGTLYYIFLFFFNVFYVFIWLQQVLAAACGIFS